MVFSAGDAAFEGFRIVRRRPLAVLAWAAAYVVFFAVGFLLVGKSFMSVMTQIEALQQAGTPTLTEMQPLMQAYGVIFAVAAPLSILISTMLSAAIARSVVRPKDSAWGYLRLGRDELRVFGAMIALTVCVMIYYIAVGAVCVALGVAAQTTGQGWLWAICGLAGVAGVLGLIWLAIRLSLAVPIIVAEKRFTVFASFALTKGRFWPLLGMALIAGVMMIVVALLGGFITMPITLLTGGSLVTQMQGLENLPMAQVLPKLAPVLIVYGVLNAILSALQLAVLYAPFSAAYRAIKGVTEA